MVDLLRKIGVVEMVFAPAFLSFALTGQLRIVAVFFLWAAVVAFVHGALLVALPTVIAPLFKHRY